MDLDNSAPEERPTADANSSRRAFIAGSVIAGGSVLMRSALAQGPGAAPGAAPSAVNFTNEQIVEITMVVHDAAKTARNFSHIFGPSWRFYDFRPSNVVVNDKPVSEPVVLKLAVGRCGGHTFKLVQPVSGPSHYAEFLQRNGGEGFYSIGVGAVRGYEPTVAALKQAGVSIAMQADVGNGSAFTVFETAADLGPRVEVASTPKQIDSPLLKETGRFAPSAAPVFDMELPVLSGGRRFTQIGTVVPDARRAASRYESLLGIGNWHFQPIPVSAASLHGKVYTEAELPSATVLQGGAYLGGTQIELLEPVKQDPGGIHRKFLDKHGSYNGFQHLMISPAAGDHDSALERLTKEGIQREWTATVHLGKMTGSGDYIDLESRIGGFVLEFNG
jgi:methylmalonyl-CoA/ethylmalonyl-CoA epimerase